MEGAFFIWRNSVKHFGDDVVLISGNISQKREDSFDEPKGYKVNIVEI